MDNNGKPKRFFDVSKPGSSPATPNSRSTITNQGAPVTSDPMFTSSPQTPQNVPTPEPQDAPQTEAPQQVMSVPAQANYREEAPLDLIKPEAFVTHVGGRKKGKKMMLGVVLAILIFAGAAGAYWFTRMKPANKTDANTQPTTNVKKTEDQKTAKTKDTPTAKYSFVAPDGYMTYVDKSSGFSFAYPKQFGDMTKVTDLVDDTGNKVTSKYQTISLVDGKSTILGVAGQFGLYTYPSKTSDITSRKYGPQIALKNKEWIVTKISEGDVVENKVDSVYLDFSNAKPVVQQNGAISVYTFTGGDEGVQQLKIAFVTDTLHVITLPSFNSGTYGTSTKENDPSAFKAMTKNIVDSITSL
ncbi:MAG: hypothetical protein NTX11_04505 [Candidatus Saccharibacteria bacterium]|nr:hypothetical protein [Candidatus Saccharibacteria bacterium]